MRIQMTVSRPPKSKCETLAMPVSREGRLVLRRRDLARAALPMLMLGSCTQQVGQTPAVGPEVSAPLPFSDAVLQAANAIFSSAAASASRPVVVIDPLINGITGEQSVATQTIGVRIEELAREKYPQFEVKQFAPETISRLPYVIVGTFTPVDAKNQPAGNREAFRFCLIMADLRSGRVVARKWVRVAMGGVDSTPIAFFRDSPAWTEDSQTKSYIDSCQETHVGDLLSPVYVNGILTASIISEATDAYNSGRYVDALNLYTNARATATGNQLRVLNGLYLSNWKLGRQGTTETAFGELVNYGLSNRRLTVKFLFNPGSIGLNAADGQPYDMWLQKIATGAAEKRSCLEVIGNTSKSGSAALNERLSGQRAEHIKARLENDVPSLAGHVTAIGVGASANLIGTGADDLSDALDRRVEFKVNSAC
jgi:outer membrane protein OmpA-like peptidoglycan-associated protein